MNMPWWRTGLATAVDVCIGAVPLLVAAAMWAGVASAFVDQNASVGWGAAVYYGPTAVLVTGYAVVWAFFMKLAHVGRLPIRSVGLVVAGVRFEEGLRVVSHLSDHWARPVLLRTGASVMAALGVLAAGMGAHILLDMLLSLAM